MNPTPREVSEDLLGGPGGVRHGLIIINTDKPTPRTRTRTGDRTVARTANHTHTRTHTHTGG